ncbi:ABC transporter substrate-binding protein [Blastococcus saxobsidens]|uniref:Putative Extracellular solute-binding protein n=1 Tax=Blastococcus saxobsidens (strain DD2) TaxID=1146883 RepID=H6RN65_BLASD|nr:ABC transporter substrate-binding protein [Blastococcus saxobsidens]CCG02613.1 putative Extracellular solute-binding protein [Blastococcus saxobsidens DD2]
MRSRAPAATALVATASVLLAACGGADSSDGGTATGACGGSGALTLGLTSAPLSLDPSAAANGNNSQWYITPAYAPLIRTGENAELVPGLAEEWGYVGDENKTFELTLRPDLKFADGTPLTAQDVANSIEYFKTGSGPGSGFFRNLTATAEGEDKVVITSTEPDPSIPLLLTAKWMGGSVISPAGLADPSQLASDTFGAGPYVLDEQQTVSGDSYVYTPNENYYDQDAIQYDEIVVKVIPDANSMAQALRSGQVDVVESEPATAASLEEADGVSVVSAPVSVDGLYFLDWEGTVAEPLASLQVRQALNHAIDRESIVEAIYGEYGIPVQQPTVPGDPTFGYSEEANSTYDYDPEKARQMLADAGYPEGFEITSLVRANFAAEAKMMQAVASQLAEVGVTLSLKPAQNTGAWVDDLVSGQYPMTAQVTSGKPAIMQIPYLFMPGGIMNPFNASNAEVTAAYQELQTAAPEDVPEAATQAIQTAVDQALMAPVVAVDDIFAYSDEKVAGVEFLGDTPTLSQMDTWTPAC